MKEGIKLIQTSAEFEDFVKELEISTSISIDLEFDKNRNRYGFNICLIQICLKEGGCFVLDPLNKAYDYKRIFPFLENPEVEKIAYAFGEDYRLLLTLGCTPKGVFDLNFAVILLNHSHTGLTTVLENVLDIKSKPSAQMSNWFIRPLSEKQIIYAAEDVMYLHELKETLVSQAKEKGILDWVKEENGHLNEMQFEENIEDNLHKEKYKNGLNEVQWYTLKALLSYREEIAEEMNRPSYQVIPNHLILEINSEPNNLETLITDRAIHRKLKNSNFKKKLQEIIVTSKKEALDLGLSEEKQAKKKLSSEVWEEMQREKKLVEMKKKEIFKPIQLRIAEDYGEFVAPYVLSNRLMKNLILLRESPIKEYKKQLILKYGEVLGFDMSEYLSK